MGQAWAIITVVIICVQADDGADELQALLDEICTLVTLGQHPNITQARALATLDLPGGGHVVYGLAMACCRGGSLSDLLR